MDICKCDGEGCVKREKCLRYTIPSEILDSYFSESPIKDGECDYYLDNSKEKGLKK